MNFMLLFFFCWSNILNSKLKKVWDFLKSKGLTNAGVPCLMGNLYSEFKIESVVTKKNIIKQLA